MTRVTGHQVSTSLGQGAQAGDNCGGNFTALMPFNTWKGPRLRLFKEGWIPLAMTPTTEQILGPKSLNFMGLLLLWFNMVLLMLIR